MTDTPAERRTTPSYNMSSIEQAMLGRCMGGIRLRDSSPVVPPKTSGDKLENDIRREQKDWTSAEWPFGRLAG